VMYSNSIAGNPRDSSIRVWGMVVIADCQPGRMTSEMFIKVSNVGRPDVWSAQIGGWE